MSGHNGSAGTDEGIDLLENGRVDRVRVGEDKDGVADAVSRREAAVADGEPGEESIGIGDIVVVAGAEGGRIAARENEVHAGVAVIVEHVRDEAAALEEE